MLGSLVMGTGRPNPILLASCLRTVQVVPSHNGLSTLVQAILLGNAVALRMRGLSLNGPGSTIQIASPLFFFQSSGQLPFGSFKKSGP